MSFIQPGINEGDKLKVLPVVENFTKLPLDHPRPPIWRKRFMDFRVN